MLILIFPGGFRITCYYYRGAYYKAFWADPPNCTVGEPRKKYLGERYFPLIIQNIHRYFLYVALLFLVFLAHDVWKALWFDGKFGIGVGHAGAADQSSSCLAATRRLSFAPPSGGRNVRCALAPADPQENVRLRELHESPPHAVCVDEPVLGRLLRSVRKDVLHGHLDGLENLLMARNTKRSNMTCW